MTVIPLEPKIWNILARKPMILIDRLYKKIPGGTEPRVLPDKPSARPEDQPFKIR
jgi:hypothetical protein